MLRALQLLVSASVLFSLLPAKATSFAWDTAMKVQSPVLPNFSSASGSRSSATNDNNDKSVIDSLEAVLASAMHLQRIDILNELAFEYLYISLERAADYQREAKRLAEQLQYPQGAAMAFVQEAAISRMRNNHAHAIECSRHALDIFRRIGDKRGVAKALHALGTSYAAKQDYLNSRLHLLQSLDASESVGDMFQSARTYNMISEDYLAQGDNDKALDFALRSLELHRKHADKRWLALQMDNVGFIYAHMDKRELALHYYTQAYTTLLALRRKGQHRLANSCKNIANAYRALGQYKEALAWALYGIDLQQSSSWKFGSLNGMRGNYRALAEVFAAMGNIDSALVWNQRILRLPSAVSSYSVYVLQDIAKLYARKGRCDLSLVSAREAWAMALRLEQAKPKEVAARTMADALAFCRQYDSAYWYQSHYTRLHDSLTSIEKGKQIERLQAIHDLDRQSAENERLRQENSVQESVIMRQTLAVVVVGALLCCAILLLVLLYRANHRNRQTSLRLHTSNEELDTALRDLRETQAQLVQSERMNAAGMLTAGVMHEINNPNAAVYAALEELQRNNRSIEEFFVSLLREEDKQSPEAQRFFAMTTATAKMISLALTGAERIKHIVASLRNFTKHQEAGKKQASLEQEILTTIEMFRFQYKNIVVQTHFNTPCVIEANFAEINQVFLNLLVNAAQAGATAIQITAIEDATRPLLCVEVIDNGKGMDATTLNKIFDPFYTVGKDAHNSGLGLSISKSIMERHHGTIYAKSKEGRGTCFTLEFPLRSNAQAQVLSSMNAE